MDMMLDEVETIEHCDLSHEMGQELMIAKSIELGSKSNFSENSNVNVKVIR